MIERRINRCSQLLMLRFLAALPVQLHPEQEQEHLGQGQEQGLELENPDYLFSPEKTRFGGQHTGLITTFT